MGKIALMIRKKVMMEVDEIVRYNSRNEILNELDVYGYGEKELEQEIIELIGKELINKDIICGIIGNGIQEYFLTWKLTDQNVECICSIVNEISVKIKENLAKLKNE